MMGSEIALVLDLDFGDSLIELAKKMPVWIIESAENNNAKDIVIKQPDISDRVTIIFARECEPLEGVFLRSLYNIEDHHGAASFPENPYKEIHVYGIAMESVTNEIMIDLEFDNIETTDFGFRIIKSQK